MCCGFWPHEGTGGKVDRESAVEFGLFLHHTEMPFGGTQYL